MPRSRNLQELQVDVQQVAGQGGTKSATEKRIVYTSAQPMDTQSSKRQRNTGIGAGAPRQPVKTEYIYHWNRIYGALALLLLLIGLTGYAIHAWVSSPSASGDGGFEVGEAPVALVAEANEENAGDGAPEVLEPAVTTVPDSALSDAPILPLEWTSPAEAEKAEDATEGSLRVFLPPDTRVNLRAAPSLSSPVLRILDARDELLLLETGTRFHQVRAAGGIVGWVSRDFSSLEPYPAPTGD